jgi:hypothetical protein
VRPAGECGRLFRRYTLSTILKLRDVPAELSWLVSASPPDAAEGGQMRAMLSVDFRRGHRADRLPGGRPQAVHRPGRRCSRPARFRGIRGDRIDDQDAASAAARGFAHRGRAPIDKSAIYKLLANRTYASETHHKGQYFPAEHEPIIPRELSDRVRAKVQEDPRLRANQSRRPSAVLL